MWWCHPLVFAQQGQYSCLRTSQSSRILLVSELMVSYGVQTWTLPSSSVSVTLRSGYSEWWYQDLGYVLKWAPFKVKSTLRAPIPLSNWGGILSRHAQSCAWCSWEVLAWMPPTLSSFGFWFDQSLIDQSSGAREWLSWDPPCDLNWSQKRI